MKGRISMSRSASCIQMLLLLKARGFMSRSELAQELQCNVRNIAEYKKELEEAGYHIDSTTGKFGGYTLHRGTLLPVHSFTPYEVRALQEARLFIQSHHDFLMRQEFEKAMDKVQANLVSNTKDRDIYMEYDVEPITERMRKAIGVCEQAIKSGLRLELGYRSLRSKEVQKVQVMPYEILNYKGSYYCIGYSLKAKDYRTFKFSEERMKEVVMLNIPFQRDTEFKLKDHIGESGLVKDEVFELDMYIYRERARRIAEKRVGIDPKMEWMDEDTLHFTTIMEGEIECIAFLLSLGADVTLLSPEHLKLKMLQIIKDMGEAYSNSSHSLL